MNSPSVENGVVCCRRRIEIEVNNKRRCSGEMKPKSQYLDLLAIASTIAKAMAGSKPAAVESSHSED
jgi:hypothetical protein